MFPLMEYSTIMKKLKWLFMNGCKSMIAISSAREFLN